MPVIVTPFMSKRGQLFAAFAVTMLVVVIGGRPVTAEDDISQRATYDLAASWALTLDAAEAYTRQSGNTPEETT